MSAIIFRIALKTFLLGILSSIAHSSELPSNQHDKLFQVPLTKTIHERELFMNYMKNLKADELFESYKEWIDVIGANGIVSILKDQFPQCHNRGHELGRLIYLRSHSISGSLATCDGACNSGCMHGVFKAAFSTISDKTEDVTIQSIAARAEEICEEETQYRLGDCLHGHRSRLYGYGGL